ncbi:hypothetical protein M422DRAFT_268395 [Sphaerobolus stellatus SS14]|uniref:CCHC-type domain-containing protein n=1 Tax=Sphaerobolus stellatus (strain SS14) TaxID=990650 RepID=A0A0C9UXP5_SPHS4|nr:hypothetical protein M422DRAFT_268395 [Sphaerobolus stellatus SS14]
MAPKKKTSDKVPTGTGDAIDSGSTPNVASRNDPTLDPGKDPSQAVSATSETNTICPTTRSTHVTDQLAQPASEWGMSEDPTQTPNPYGGSGDPFLPKTYSEYSEPSERSTLADPNPKELALGDQIQEMLNTINEHMDEVKTIHNMSCQVAQLEKYLTIAKGKSSIHPRDPTWDPNDEEINLHSERPTHWLNNHADEESMNGQPNIDPELMQTIPRPNNRSGTKHALSKARSKLSAKTAVLERLYADQAPADHLNGSQEYLYGIRVNAQIDENPRDDEGWEKPRKSIQYTPFNGIEDNDTDSEPTVRNHREGFVPFQHIDDRDILDMPNNEGDNPLVRIVKYMLDQNINNTMEKSPLAKAGVKVTPPNKYCREQSFKALETFVKGLLRWLDMHSMLGPDAYKYQVSFLGTRLEGKALEWFYKTVEPRKYQSTPMDLEQVMTGLYSQACLVYKSSLLNSNYMCHEWSNDLTHTHFTRRYDPEKKTIHKLYLKAVKLEDTNHYDIGVHNSEPMTSNSRWNDNISSNTRCKPRNNGLDRTKSHANTPKTGEISKGPSITPGPSGVNRNSLTAPGGAGPPIHNRQWTNHESSHNSIECYNCGKVGHIKPNCPELIRAHHIGAIHVEDYPEGQVDDADLDINDNIDDERLDEDKYHNNEFDNQLDLSEDQCSWGSKPSKFNWSDDEQPH